MNNSQDIAATIVAAVIGGVAGFLFFTERGRRVRRQAGPMLEEFSREVMSFRNTFQEVGGVANEGYKLFHDMLGEGGEPLARYPGGHVAVLR